MANWDIRFLDLALQVAGWSKDPSTKVGAVIVRPDKSVAALGFNGFPRGIADDWRLDDRDFKYPIVKHAELNAILSAREPLHGYTIYSTLHPCTPCAGDIIQVGIKRVVTFEPSPEHVERHRLHLARKLLLEAKIAVSIFLP